VIVDYGFDDRGNLIKHNTAKINRTYQYAGNGDVVSESEGFIGLKATETNYTYNADGLMASLTENQQITRFDYNATGRLGKVTFPDGASHQYQYDKLGFRKQTERSDETNEKYNYDRIGNLIELVKYNAGDVANQDKSNKLKLNAYNQLTQVMGADRVQMAIEYTAKGNPKSMTKGERTVQYQYDVLGRLIGVSDSKNGQASYEYQNDEDDIRLQFDTQTKPVKTQQTQITGHNQSQSQLHYARQSGSPWQAIVWNASLAKLLVPSPESINSPDAGLQSSKQRRRLFDAKSTIKRQQHKFDKPSNAHWIPVEYSAINCDNSPKDCTNFGVSLDPASGITVGTPYTFQAFSARGSDCRMQYTYLVDGAIAGFGYNNSLSTTFTLSGEHTVMVYSECECGGYPLWAVILCGRLSFVGCYEF
jgi:YD repeat-containing protein